MSAVTARSPAKLILSGEHAVVYGCPALSVAIDRYTTTTVDRGSSLHFVFRLLGLNMKKHITRHALCRLQKKIYDQYHRFQNGRLCISEVLKKPFELSFYTATKILKKFTHHLPFGLNINVNSNIPVGYGLGSSAACIISLMKALCCFLEIPMTEEDFFLIGLESENLQHGRSSGLDLQTSYRGGVLWYERGLCTPRSFQVPPFYLVLTGKPQTSTGLCVQAVAHRFLNENLKKDFSETTYELDQALQMGDLKKIQDSIRRNHRLLQSLGVVPDRVAQFIQAIEAQAGAAKISGSGSVRGPLCGALIVWSEYSTVQALCAQYGYHFYTVRQDSCGATVF